MILAFEKKKKKGISWPIGMVPVCTHWEQYVKPCASHKKAYNTNHLGENVFINVILRKRMKSLSIRL